MNREDIIRMAREAGEAEGMVEFVFHPVIERFAALVASAAQAKEREACAKVCDGLNFIDNGTPAGTRASNRHCAAAIRARGQA